MDLLLLLKLINGITAGAIYALTAFGLTMILGMLNIPNFAHGVLFAIGAYVGYSVLLATGSFWLALIVAPIVVAVFGILVERGMLQFLYGDTMEHETHQLLVLFAISIAMQEVIILIWGASGQSALPPPALLGAVSLGPIMYPKYRVFALLMSLLVIALSWLFIERTRLGALIKAAIDKREMVMLLGVDVRYLYALSFGLGAAFAALAGIVSLPIRGVHPFIGADILALSFVIVVVGGLGNLYGAIAAGILIGVAQEFATLIDPLASWAVIYALMMLVLVIRPQGLFGTR